MTNRATGVFLVLGLCGTALQSEVSASPRLVEQYQVTADIAQDNNWFGRAIALSEEYLVVGAPLQDVPWYEESQQIYERGAVYTFDLATGLLSYVLRPDEGSDISSFGSALAIDDGVLVVGAPRDRRNNRTTNFGNVFLYDVSTGDLIRQLTPLDHHEGEGFGAAVDIRNGQVLVGKPTESSESGSSENQYGSAYLFDVSTGQQLHKFEAVQPVNQIFGRTVYLGSGVVSIGSNWQGGRVDVFDVSTKEHLYGLWENFPYFQFGSTTMTVGDRLLITSPRTNEDGENRGALFSHDLADGEFAERVFPSMPSNYRSFGISLDQARNSVVVLARTIPDRNDATAFVYGAQTLNLIGQTSLVRSIPGDDTIPTAGHPSGVFAVGDFYSTGGSGPGSVTVYRLFVADFDGDGIVDQTDLAIMLASWGAESADLDGDGFTGPSDLAILLSEWD